MHWDVTLVDTTIEGLVAAGARCCEPKGDGLRWTVMADPEGNEFCAFDESSLGLGLRTKGD
jgi:hypothetical protein